jgi:hypothetical protein
VPGVQSDDILNKVLSFSGGALTNIDRAQIRLKYLPFFFSFLFLFSLLELTFCARDQYVGIEERVQDARGVRQPGQGALQEPAAQPGHHPTLYTSSLNNNYYYYYYY